MKIDNNFIINLRKKTNLSQNLFGHIFCVTGSVVTLWEKGSRKPDDFKLIAMQELNNKLDINQNIDLEKLLLIYGTVGVLKYIFQK